MSYARFLLDGQTAILDDYLEVRPEAAARAAPARRRRDASRSGRGWSRWTSSWCRARRWCATSSSASRRPRSYGGAMPVGYLPDIFGHIAQMPQLLRLVGIEHAVAWRGIPSSGRQDRLLRGRRPTARACAASTCTAPTRTGATSPRTPRDCVLRAVDYQQELGDVRLARHAVDERHRPPDAAAVARPGRRRGQRDPGRLPTSSSRRCPSTSPQQPVDGLADGRRRAALGRARQHLDGCRVEPGRRAPGVRGRRARARAARRADVRRCSCRPTQYPHSLLDARVAQRRAEQRPRLVVRVQRTTRSSTTCSCATAKRARSATGSSATRCTRSRTRSTRRRARPSS